MENLPITVFAGLFVFITSQYILKLIIEPSIELKKALSGVSASLLLNQAKITNATSNDEIATDIKQHSASIVAKSSVIVGYPIVYWFLRLPQKNDILDASRELNSIYHGMRKETQEFENSKYYNAKKTNWAFENHNSLKKIERLLKIPTSYS